MTDRLYEGRWASNKSFERKSEWSHSEVINEGVVAENIWGEIADDQMQREKTLIVDPKKRAALQRNLASAKAKTRDGGVEASKSKLDFYTKLLGKEI